MDRNSSNYQPNLNAECCMEKQSKALDLLKNALNELMWETKEHKGMARYKMHRTNHDLSMVADDIK